MTSSENLIHVFSGDQHQVFILNKILSSKHIPSIIKDNYQSGVIAGFGGGTQSTIELYIKEKDLEKATPIITLFNQENKP